MNGVAVYMHKILVTSNVAIDTEAIVSLNFTFDGPLLRQFAIFGANGLLKLFVTDVVDREIRHQIHKRAEATVQSARRFVKAAPIVRNLGAQGFQFILDLRDHETIEAELLRQYDEYLKLGQFEIIESNTIAVTAILDRYFIGEPPFGVGRKKDEFPDAISMVAMEVWCRYGRESTMAIRNLYVISGDTDISSACTPSSGLFHIPSVRSLLDVANYTFGGDMANDIMDAVDAQVEDVLPLVAGQLELLPFLIEDVPWSDANVVESIEITDIEISSSELIETQENHALVGMTATIEFLAVVLFIDPDDPFYDAATGTYDYSARRRKRVRDHITDDIIVDAQFDPERISPLKFDHVRLQRSREIVIRVGEHRG